MQKYIKVYFDARGKDVTDFIACELCHKPAIEIHHCMGRRKELLNDPNNLIALCRKCHTNAHSHNSLENKKKLLDIVKKNLLSA